MITIQRIRKQGLRLLKLLAPPRRGGPSPGSTATLPYDKKAQEAGQGLWDASRRLLEKGQVGSGVDLAVMLIEDVWRAREVGCGKEERGELPFHLPVIPNRVLFNPRTVSWR